MLRIAKHAVTVKNVAGFLYVKTNSISRLAGKSSHAHAAIFYPGRNVWILVREIPLHSKPRGLNKREMEGFAI